MERPVITQKESIQRRTATQEKTWWDVSCVPLSFFPSLSRSLRHKEELDKVSAYLVQLERRGPRFHLIHKLEFPQDPQETVPAQLLRK